MRKIYILPNLFTSGSLFAGMLAIFEIFAPEGDLRMACWLILLSAVLDVCDGAIARLTHTTSAFGLNLDSLADLVAFGVAPALLTFKAFYLVYPRMAATVCSLYVVCGALRLARFNVQVAREERKSFIGLPIPGAALAVTSMVWVFLINPHLLTPETLARICPPAMVVISYLMVSKIPYLSFKQINLADRQPFEILVTLIVVALLLYMLKQDLDLVIAVTSWVYVITGLTVWAARHARGVPARRGVHEHERDRLARPSGSPRSE